MTGWNDLTWYVVERDVIGLDKTGQKVLFLAADSDVDQLTFHLSQLKR